VQAPLGTALPESIVADDASGNGPYWALRVHLHGKVSD
jgi:hypothetical protein